MDEMLYTARQAALRLGIPYPRVNYALMRYDTHQYERYTTRLVTLAQVQAALAQVKPSARRVDVSA
jgi:hypothetical protein